MFVEYVEELRPNFLGETSVAPPPPPPLPPKKTLAGHVRTWLWPLVQPLLEIVDCFPQLLGLLDLALIHIGLPKHTDVLFDCASQVNHAVGYCMLLGFYEA